MKKGKTKLLFVTNLYPSEKEPNRGVYIQNQAEALWNSGYQVTVLQMDYRSVRKKRKWGICWRNQNMIPVCHFSIPISPFTNLIYMLAGLLTDYGVSCVEEKVGHIDVIHGHFLEGAYGLAYCKAKRDIPIVMTEHGSNLLDGNRHASDERRMHKLYSSVDEMIVVGRQQYECAKKLCSTSLQLVPNVIPAYFTYRKSEKRERTNIFSFISVGNLIESKCFGLLIDSFSDLCEKNDRVKLVIVGSGPLEKSLKAKVEKLELAEYVTFTGPMKNVQLVQLYQEADCFVLPSRYETFGVVYAEALCTGTPIISTKNGGIEEIFEEGCGLLVPVDDREALTLAMRKVMREQYDHEKIASHFQQKFGQQRFVRQMESVYNKAMKANDRAEALQADSQKN